MRARIRWLTLRFAPFFVAAVACVLGAGASACRPKAGARAAIVVSIFPLYDLVRRVAGPDADVTLLYASGSDVRDFEPTPRETQEAASARLGVMVGLGLDSWMAKVLPPKARVLKVGDRVPTLAAKGEPGGERAIDPYVWLDPQRTAVMTKAIADEIAKLDAAHAMAYRKRAEEVVNALDALDQEVFAKTSTWKTRTFATTHGSFAYFAERYRFQIAVADPTLAPLALDPFGGSAETDSYEKMIRLDVALLEKALR